MADTNSQISGRNVVAYLGANGCDCSQSLASVVHEFQLAYNQDVKANIYNGPQLEIDGKYGNDTSSAMQEVFGSQVPRPCYSAGNPCFGKGILPGGKPVPPGTVIIPTSPPTGGTTTPITNPPPPQTQTSAKTNFTPWLVAGAALLAAGAGYVYYTKQQEQNRTSRMATTRRIPFRR